MYLSRLEMMGFKSFRRRARLSFAPGLTAVVGPNGSGKSNIADAVRWALGEQRLRQLRCDQSRQLVFSGKGAPGLAEVGMQLDNSTGGLALGFSEISLTRRLYRSGENEYRLNGAPCRLRDVQELFLDTGLGKGSYALIGQGQVEELLSMRPDERRVLLEEAAGTHKYRLRKAEIWRRLEETEHNLARLQDVLEDAWRNRGQLQREAELERRYRSLLEKWEEGRNNRRLREMQQLHSRLEKLSLMQAEAQGQLDQCSEQKALLESETNEIENELQTRRHDLRRLERQLERSQSDLNSLRERRDNLRERRRRLVGLVWEEKRHRQQQGARLRGLQDAKQNLRRDLLRVMLDWEDTRRQLWFWQGEKEKRAASQSGLESAMETGRDEVLELERSRAMLENEMEHLAQRRARSGYRYMQHRARLLEVAYRLEILESTSRITGRSLVAARLQLQRLSRRTGVITFLLHSAAGRARRLEQWWFHARAEANRNRERGSMLEQLEEQLAGYPEGVKHLLREERLHSWGTLARCLDVPQDMERAVSAFLGSRLYWVVVPDENYSYQAARLLRQQETRATVVSLQNLLPGERLVLSPELCRRAGCRGSLADAVKPRFPELQPVVEFFLGSAFLVDRIPGLGFEPPGAWLVTAEGVVAGAGGVLASGPPASGPQQVLGRPREREELARRYRRWQSRGARLRGELERFQAMVTRLEETQAYVEDLQQRSEERQREAWEERSRQVDAYRNLQQEKQALRWELAVAWEEMKETGEQDQRTREKRREKESQLHRIQAALAQVAAERQGLLSWMEEATQTIMSLEGKAATVDENRVSLRQRIQDLGQQQQDAREHLERSVQRLQEYRDEGRDLKRQLRDIAAREHQLGQDRELCYIKVKDLRRAVAQGEEGIASRRERFSALQSACQELQQESASLFERKARLEGDMERQVQQWREEQGTEEPWNQITQAAAGGVPSRETLTEWRRELDAMGDLNLQAARQLAALEERCRFLEEQQQDLRSGKQALQTTLSEVDEASKVRLSRALEEVQAEFGSVFSRLFNGGQARLFWSDARDPLQSGLDVEVKVPGKAQQKLSLLSGGEKALGAIALLFALLRVNPSPFCVLDEIDTALDEANGSRLANFLEEEQKQTQFIIITHRPEVVEKTSQVYGVIAGPDGDSRVISLSLRDWPQHLERVGSEIVGGGR